ncbi:MAG: toll/interleukin-1 receptor domain-containing protein [Flavobacteriaceae bacterium]|nr:toll/interleukin-1 receptor domain-containing protein [Flavobacteriaceae bacterium]
MIIKLLSFRKFTLIILYYGTGSKSFEILDENFSKKRLHHLISNIQKILLKRNQLEAFKLLDTIPFKIHRGTNNFGDEFSLMYCSLPFDEYEKIRLLNNNVSISSNCKLIADTMLEIEVYIRFIVVDLKLEEENKWDLFICHTSEDKETIVNPLVKLLGKSDYNIWIDDHILTLGDSLRQEIDKGLTQCDFGLVILSPSFFSKEWPQKELDALVSLEIYQKSKKILPIRHNIEINQILQYSPLLASKFIVSSSIGIDAIVREIELAIIKENS